jgi:hypothetical protein
MVPCDSFLPVSGSAACLAFEDVAHKRLGSNLSMLMTLSEDAYATFQRRPRLVEPWAHLDSLTVRLQSEMRHLLSELNRIEAAPSPRGSPLPSESQLSSVSSASNAAAATADAATSAAAATLMAAEALMLSASLMPMQQPVVLSMPVSTSISSASASAQPRIALPIRKKRGPKPMDRSGFYCHQCFSRDTPEWRSGPDGPRTLCNACGLSWRNIRLKAAAASTASASAPSCASAANTTSEFKMNISNLLN